MFDILKDILSVGVISTVGLTLIGRMLPNSKVYMGGFQLGALLTTYGTSKLGGAWEKVETFFTNSAGYFFSGFKDGLNSDEGEESGPNPPKEDPKGKVRI